MRPSVLRDAKAFNYLITFYKLSSAKLSQCPSFLLFPAACSPVFCLLTPVPIYFLPALAAIISFILHSSLLFSSLLLWMKNSFVLTVYICGAEAIVSTAERRKNRKNEFIAGILLHEYEAFFTPCM